MAIGLLNRLTPSLGTNDEKKAELTEHLAELRSRLIRSASYIVVGCVICFFLFPQISAVVFQPVVEALKQAAKHHPGAYSPFPAGTFVFHAFYAPFFLQVQLSLYGGLILGSPLVVTEIWAFVSPGLTQSERRPVRYIAPFSVFLFVSR